MCTIGAWSPPSPRWRCTRNRLLPVESGEQSSGGSTDAVRDLPVISPQSPLGLALLGHKEGETVEYEAPSGTLAVDIVEIVA